MIKKRGDQFAIEKLRPLSGVPSMKRSYLDVGAEAAVRPFQEIKRPRNNEKELVIFPSRFEVLNNRLKDKRPTRYKNIDWEAYRIDSIAILAPFYPNSNLAGLCTWIEDNSKPSHRRPLSSELILTHIRTEFTRSEIGSSDELRKLLKALGFKWGHLHSSYYLDISRRADVIAHRYDVIPMLWELMTNPNYLYVNTDWSLAYENEISKSAWISLVKKNSDLVNSKPSKGPRLSFCEFITREGIIRHTDGKSAGTILYMNETLGASEIIETFRRGFEGIANHPDVKSGEKIAVVHLDGARNQTTKDPDYINPEDMNLSDGGTNRRKMFGIGLMGIQRVLEKYGKWTPGMRLDEARKTLWGSKMVFDQLSQLEKLAREFNIILIHNPKAHPWLAFIEQLWRWIKNQLQNLLRLSEIKSKYELLIEDFMIGTDFARMKMEKWFSLSLKYVEYYSRGGTEIVKDRDMRALDLTTMSRPRPKHRFTSNSEALYETHKANFILFRGKKYLENGEFW